VAPELSFHYIQEFRVRKSLRNDVFRRDGRKRHARGVSSPERPDKMTMHFTNDSMNFHSRIGLATLLAMLLFLSARAADWPAVARDEPRQPSGTKTGHSANFSEQGIEVSLAHAGGAGLTSPVVVQGRVFLTDMRLDKPRLGNASCALRNRPASWSGVVSSELV